MAKEAAPEPQVGQEEPKKTPIKIIVLIAVPLFIVQVAILFFAVSYFLNRSSVQPAPPVNAPKSEEHGAVAEAEIFVVKDLLINPAGTNGTRYLLTTVGFEVPTAELRKQLEQREIQIRDLLINILATKTLSDLTDMERREETRKEIAKKTKELIRSEQLSNVYFSKFVIQ